ncbi:MAG: hypothetical protein AAB383_06775 [Patescibacteria group bacterium]
MSDREPIVGDDEAAIVTRAYADFDFDHEPFRRRATTHEQMAEAAYSEVDETWVRELEENTFHPEDHCPPPPEGLPETHPLLIAWGKVLEAKNELNENVDGVKETHDYFQKRVNELIEPPEVDKELEAARAKVKKNLNLFAKAKMRANLYLKKCLFQRIIAYLYLYRDTPECEPNQNADELLRQTEVIFCAHTTFPVVRSATHIFGPRRENGDLVMDHIYKTCVYVMNRFHRLLHGAESSEEMHWLYEVLIIAIEVAIPHDYLEDFKRMTPGFLDVKMSEHLTFDTVVEAPIRMAPFVKQVPEHTNPYARNKGTIVNCLHALTKPAKDSPDYENYLNKQVVQNEKLSNLEKVVCAMVKTGDRLHNLDTLGAKALPKQVSYLNETIEDVISMVTAVQKETGAPYLTDDLFSLNMAVVKVAINLQKRHASEIQSLGLNEELNRIIRKSSMG